MLIAAHGVRMVSRALRFRAGMVAQLRAVVRLLTLAENDRAGARGHEGVAQHNWARASGAGPAEGARQVPPRCGAPQPSGISVSLCAVRWAWVFLRPGCTKASAHQSKYAIRDAMCYVVLYVDVR